MTGDELTPDDERTLTVEQVSSRIAHLRRDLLAWESLVNAWGLLAMTAATAKSTLKAWCDGAGKRPFVSDAAAREHLRAIGKPDRTVYACGPHFHVSRWPAAPASGPSTPTEEMPRAA